MASDHSSERATLSTALDRYRDLVGDFSAFIDALLHPHIPCVWVNPLRADDARVTAWMTAEGLRPEPIPWRVGGYRVPFAGVHERPRERHSGPGSSWLYQAGLYQVQEESSMLPVHLLDPRPGDRVLDMCAAPGNKTAQIAVALGGRGTVIANDRKRKRLAALHNAVSRLGLFNVTMTEADGRTFPAQPEPFDRVLVDAPCSAEGTVRKLRRVGERGGGFGAYITGVQRALLTRALQLTRPGGRVVYSTCTFAPEENEMVVDEVLAAHPGCARIVPVAPLPGLPLDPGVNEWRGRRLASEVTGCARLWPHRTGTGGFFVAVLERSEIPMADSAGTHTRRPTAAAQPAGPPAIPALEHESVAACRSRYAIDARHFDDLAIARRGRYLRLRASDHRVPTDIAIVATGLAALPAKARQARFTTAGAMAFGAHAGRHAIDLDPAHCARYLRREDISLHIHTGQHSEGGYLIVRRNDRSDAKVALGNAEFIAPGSDSGTLGVLASRFPQAWIRGARRE